MLKINKEIDDNPQELKDAPHQTPVKRVDEVKAARNPDLRWKKSF
jgi:glycine dehydrogenase subunit 2